MTKALVLNFGHPFSPTALYQLKSLYADYNLSVVQVNSQIDQNQEFLSQVKKMLKQVVTNEPVDKVIVNLPGYSLTASFATVLLLQTYGEIEVIRLKPVTTTVQTEYHVDSAYTIFKVADSFEIVKADRAL